MNPTFKRVLIWGSVTAALALMVFGLAKLGTKSATPKNLTLKNSAAAADWSKGNENALNVLVEYSDFQCPACALYYPVVKRLAAEIPDKVRVVYRHFPLRQTHQFAQIAAEASEAAGNQGKFWDMHDILFNTQDTWSKEKNPEESFAKYAGSLGLDVEKFKQDLKSPETKQKVQEDLTSAEAMRLNQTPTFFLNGSQISPRASYEEFKQLIESAAPPQTANP